MSDRPRFTLNVTDAAEIGFVVTMDGVVVAALSTRAEVAQYIEDKLGAVMPELIERERAEIEQARQEFPRVIAGGERKRQWFRGQS